jgi:hypothetical protein
MFFGFTISIVLRHANEVVISAASYRVNEITIDYDLLSADEVDDIQDGLSKHYSESDESLYTFWGFHVLDFDALYDVVSGVLEVRRRGRLPILGPKDCFLVLLYWSRTGASTDKIEQSLQLCGATSYRRLREVIHLVQVPLLKAFIAAVAQAPLPTDQDFPMCGFIVDATIQNRGRPLGAWEQARKYFSGKGNVLWPARTSGRL